MTRQPNNRADIPHARDDCEHELTLDPILWHCKRCGRPLRGTDRVIGFGRDGAFTEVYCSFACGGGRATIMKTESESDD
jgi:hypothetical protein